MDDDDHPRREPRGGPVLMPATADKPLNGRQEAFAQAVARGRPVSAAYREAGYRQSACPHRMWRFANVRARVAHLKAETAAQARIDKDEIIERLLGIAAWGEASDSVPGHNLARQALLDLARMHGYLSAKGETPAPPPMPITEIRRVIVYPDGREEEYGAG